MFFLFFFESQIKLVENSYIDDSIVCIVRKKVDNKLTNSRYVSLLCDINTDSLVAKECCLWPTYYIFNMAPIYGYQWDFVPLLFRSWAEHCLNQSTVVYISNNLTLVLKTV